MDINLYFTEICFCQQSIHCNIQLIQYLLGTKSIDTKAEGLNCDILNVTKSKTLDIFTNHAQILE